MKNRRNFYRILHVQPEAPLEVIKASYRSLMSKLKAHPDLGGDHEAAVLINQAYAVLSNVEKRRQYDATLRATKGPATGPRSRAAGESPAACVTRDVVPGMVLVPAGSEGTSQVTNDATMALIASGMISNKRARLRASTELSTAEEAAGRDQEARTAAAPGEAASAAAR